MKFWNVKIRFISWLVIFVTSASLICLFSFTQVIAQQIDGITDAELQQMIDQYIPKINETSLPGLFMEVNPPSPGPEEAATIKITSNAINLNNSQITWFINGEIIQSGVGIKKFTFKTGKLGSHSLVVVTAKPPLGPLLKSEFDIRPTSLDVLWEALSSVPPFYRGKALSPLGGIVRVVALPGFVDILGNRIDQKNLIYKWSLGPTVLGDASGYGKNSVIVRLDDLNVRDSLEVLVTSIDGTIRAIKTVSVPTYVPKVVIYEQHPLYGLRLERGIIYTHNLRENEITLTAVPYFFNVADIISNDVSFNWKVNDDFAASGQTQNFRHGNESGVSDVYVAVDNKKQLYQNATNRLQLRFNSSPTASGF